MKKVIIISIILAALLACGGALAIFIAAQDGGIPSESIPAENTPAENVLPADENISADDEVKPVKTTLTIEEVLAAIELAKKQYAENDPVCAELGITPDPRLFQLIEDYETGGDLIDRLKSYDMYEYMNEFNDMRRAYENAIFVLVLNNIDSDNLHEDMSCSILARFSYLSPYGVDFYDDGYFVLSDLDNGLYGSAEEFLTKYRAFDRSTGLMVPAGISGFVFYPQIAEIEYCYADDVFTSPDGEHQIWPDGELQDFYKTVREIVMSKFEEK